MYSDFDSSFAGPMIAGMIVVWLIAIGIGIAIYVLGSLGLYTIAKRRYINNPWLAWIPIGNYWIAGCLADQQRLGMEENDKKLRHFACWFGLGGCVLFWIPLIGWGILVTALVFYYISLYNLFKSCNPENATLLTVLSVIFSNIAGSIILFIMRNRDDGIPENGVYAPNNIFPAS